MKGGLVIKAQERKSRGPIVHFFTYLCKTGIPPISMELHQSEVVWGEESGSQTLFLSLVQTPVVTLSCSRRLTFSKVLTDFACPISDILPLISS